MTKTYGRFGWGLIAALLFLAGCHTVPETGRRQLMLMPVGQEMALGEEAFLQIKQEEAISTNTEGAARVERVGRRIAAQVGEDYEQAQWEFVLFEGDDTLNAFALPGGGIGVYTGLLKVADTDDRLAAVMGHEIAHVTARHGAERMSRAMGLAVAGLGLDVATRNSDHRNAIMIAYGLGSTVGVELPYSRLAESEADEIGIMYAARAGYDPREAITFWQRMTEAAGDAARPPAFLSTHPADEKRIADLRKLMPEAMEEYRKATGALN